MKQYAEQYKNFESLVEVLDEHKIWKFVFVLNDKLHYVEMESHNNRVFWKSPCSSWILWYMTLLDWLMSIWVRAPTVVMHMGLN